MSKKDFDKYYTQCLEQTLMAQRECDRVKDLFLQGIYTEEQYKNVQQFTEPIVGLLSVVSKIKFLLDLPVKKQKRKKILADIQMHPINKDYVAVEKPYEELDKNWDNVNALHDYADELIQGQVIYADGKRTEEEHGGQEN